MRAVVTLTTHRTRRQATEPERPDLSAGQAQEAIVRARLFRPNQRPVAVDDADWAALCSEAGNLLWVDLQAPSDNEVARVIQAFSIDPRAVAIARSVKRRPIVRAFDDHYLVTLLSFQVDEAQQSPRIRVVEVDLLIGQNFMVSLHKRPLPFAEELAERTAANPQR